VKKERKQLKKKGGVRGGDACIKFDFLGGKERSHITQRLKTLTTGEGRKRKTKGISLAVRSDQKSVPFSQKKTTGKEGPRGVLREGRGGREPVGGQFGRGGTHPHYSPVGIKKERRKK